MDYEAALAAVSELAPALPGDRSQAQSALRWILDHAAVSCVIPGASRPEQLVDNVATSELSPLSHEARAAVDLMYDKRIRGLVHQRW